MYQGVVTLSSRKVLKNDYCHGIAIFSALVLNQNPAGRMKNLLNYYKSKRTWNTTQLMVKANALLPELPNKLQAAAHATTIGGQTN
jgi:hypothetical protein